MTTRFDQVRARCQEVIAKANQLFGLTLNPVITFDIRGTTAGSVRASRVMNPITRVVTVTSCKIRFNHAMILNDGFDHIMNNTIPHEIAHLVCYYRPELGKSHNRGWKRVCQMLVGNGVRCHREEVQYAAGGVEYTASCGTKVVFSKHRHTKIQRGVTYTLRKTGGKISRDSQWRMAA